jgi:hypothetical protein
MWRTLLPLHPEDGGSKVLRSVDTLPQHYTASQPRRPRHERLLPAPRKPECIILLCVAGYEPSYRRIVKFLSMKVHKQGGLAEVSHALTIVCQPTAFIL